MTQPLLELSDLSVTYPGQSAHGLFEKLPVFKVLGGISLSLSKGGVLGLIGESVSGKPTLGRAIVGFVPVASGRITLNGQPVSRQNGAARLPFARAVQMVLQDPYGSLLLRQAIGQTPMEPVKRVPCRNERPCQRRPDPRRYDPQLHQPLPYAIQQWPAPANRHRQ